MDAPNVEPTLQFLIMVDGALEEAELFQRIRDGLPDAVPHRRASANVRANLLEINPNEAYDPRRAATDDEEAYLYYRWRVELTPMESTVDEDHQVALARELVGVLAGDGVRTVVCANFEDRV